MATLEELIRIKKHPNPFEHVTYGNFWFEKPQYKTINLHQEAIHKIAKEIQRIKDDQLHQIRTILLAGAKGCGKSHFLGRLKEKFHSQAFFVYIQPIPNQDYLWRHTLRYTVDSLMQTPDEETDSQIRLWLKELPIFKDQGFLTKLLGQKKAFINQLRNTYPAGIYEPKKFFGMLYELVQDENYFIACDWLKGESLDEEDLEVLRVKKSIDNEIEAQGILNNFGRIANATKPIVLCFDQIERAKDDVFELNTAFHNQRLVNFVIIISAIREDWQGIKKKIVQSDISRITNTITLEDISFQEVEELWASRLEPLHSLCNPKPQSPIAPLNKSKLEEQNPEKKKINLRESLALGGICYKKYQEEIKDIIPPTTVTPKARKIPEPDLFITLWEYEFNKIKTRVTNIKQFSEPELLDMLKEVFQVYQVENISTKLLPGKNSTFSFNYTCPKTGIKQGLVWQENPNGTAFNALINACQQAGKDNLCDSLFLLRNEHMGNPKTKGNKLFHILFKPCSQEYIHLKYSLDDIHYLNTYYRLVKDAYSRELVIDFKEVSVRKLQDLVIKHQVLANCKLLQKLEIVEKPISEENGGAKELNILPSEEEIFQIVQDHLIIGIAAIHQKLQQEPKYSHVTLQDIKNIIKQINKKNKSMTILGSGEEAVISYIPQN